MRRRACAALCALAGVSVLSAQGPGPSQPRPVGSGATARRVDRGESRPLAVRRVVLYKSGVGFFEHVGRVLGNQDVTITFTSAQLDDALKSLTALDLGKGRVAGISYNSTVPLSQRLAGVSFRLTDDADRSEFFRAVRGARLEVTTRRGLVQGRLLSVDRPAPSNDAPDPPLTLMLASDTGRIASVRVGPDTSARLLDRELSESVAQYLAGVADEQRRDERRVSIATRGDGARDLYVSYISEVPVWKSTYRLLLSDADGRPPLLQGWAVVDNTGGEDWVDVEMALVAGAPQSFVQRLSQPFYLRRPIVEPPAHVQLTPQTHEGAIEASAVMSGSGGGMGLAGGVTSGIGGGQYRALAAPPPPAAMPVRPTEGPSDIASEASFESPTFRANLAADMRESMSGAEGQDIGELFEYRLADRVTVRKNQSALVPIVRAEVSAERVSLWNDALSNSRPLSAVWLSNTSQLTLDGGTVAIVDGGTFAGEGMLEPLVPGQRRLLSYGRDLSVAVNAAFAPERRQLVRLRAASGVLVEHRETCGQRTYTIRNDDRDARTVIVEHPRRHGWDLVAGAIPVESTSGVHRFRVSVPAGRTQTLLVREMLPFEQRVQAASLTSQVVDAYASQSSLGSATSGTLRRLVELRETAARLDSEHAAKAKEIVDLRAEQGHVRQNMSVLKGTSAERLLLQRYVRQLDEQETRVARLSAELSALAAQRQRARDAFDEAVKVLALDEALGGGSRCQ